MIDTTNEHLHVWTRTLDGAELANAVYDNDTDAAVAFVGIVSNVTKYNTVKLSIEDVLDSLNTGAGMYTGVPGFIVVLSRCEGGCLSVTWN